MAKRTIAELEAEIRQRDARIAELKAELDEERDRVNRLAEQVRDADDMLDQWQQAFDMVRNEQGEWTWSADFRERFATAQTWFEKHQALVRQWNKFVGEYNARVAPRNVGRPLAASDAQRTQVLKLHKAGKSLRGIAEDTSLGLMTVRTIVGQGDQRDRTTVKHLARIDPERAAANVWKAKKQMRDRLPKRINEVRAAGAELLGK